MRLGTTMATCVALLTVVLPGAAPAAAEPDCDVPDPPPICGEPEPQPNSHNPTGAIESVTRGPDGIHVRGWVRDPDLPGGPLTVYPIVGPLVLTAQAHLPRPDVNGVGFDIVAPADGLAGTGSVCGSVANVGQGNDDTDLPCRTVVVGHDPIGHLDLVESGWSGVYVRGWSIDPDTAAAITVHLYQDDVFVAERSASATRTDVGAAYPGYGTDHGFDAVLPLPANGSHRLCAYGINTGVGSVNTLLGCIAWIERHNSPPPPAIVNLTPTQLVRDGPYHMRMLYDDNSDDEWAFQVNRQDPSGEWFGHATLPSVPGRGRRDWVTLGQVDPSAHYCYSLYAITGEGAASTPGSRCEDVPPLPPLAPSNVWPSSITTTSIRWNWRDNSLDETAFVLAWGARRSSGWSAQNQVTVPAHTGVGPVSYLIDNLQPGTEYCMQVQSRAESPRRASLPTDLSCAVTPLPPPPAAPDGLTVTGSTANTLTLSWSDIATNETGYRVELHAPGGYYTEAELPANTTTYTVDRLLPNSTSCYRVVAVNLGGEGASPVVCGTTSQTPGVRTVRLWNCEVHGRAGDVYLYDLTTGGGWQRVASLPSSLVGGACSTGSIPPSASVNLPNNHLVQVAAVIPGSLTCPSPDPTKASCRVWESPVFRGDTNGIIQDGVAG